MCCPPSLVQRLTIPASCPEPFAQLMRSCWETEPERRPTCKTILDALEGMLKNGEHGVGHN